MVRNPSHIKKLGGIFMQNKQLRQHILLAIVAAIYVALTVLVAPVSYGVIQFRLSEILNHLLIYNKKFIVSLGFGVLLANFFSQAGMIDVIVGTSATLICSLLSIVAFKYIPSKMGQFIFNIFNFSVIGMIPIAIMLDALGWSEHTLLISYSTLVISEAIVMTIGIIVMQFLEKTTVFKQISQY